MTDKLRGGTTIGGNIAWHSGNLSLDLLGYTGAIDADKYTSWNVAASGTSGSSTITSGNTVTFTGTGATTVTRSGDNITIASTDTNTNTTYTAGGGLTLSGTVFSHTDTSSQASVNNSGATVIQDVTLDTYGHVTGLASKTLSASDVGAMVSFQVEDGDGTEVTISNAKEWKFTEGAGININWTDTSTGSDADPYDLQFDVLYLPAADDRDIKPNVAHTTARKVSAYFTSKEGLTSTAGTDWQDLLVMDTYSSSSGGNLNALAFDKSTKLLRLYQASTTATSWGTPYTIAMLEKAQTFTETQTIANGKQITFNGNTQQTLTSGAGISGGGDGASNTVSNLTLHSWYGIGFASSISGQTIPQGENAAFINTRTGEFTSRGITRSTKFLATLNGSVSAPSFSFNSDTNLGLYRKAADQLGVTCGNDNQLTFTSGTYGIDMHSAIDMNNGAIHYASEVHFNSGARFRNSSSSEIEHKSGSDTTGAMEFLTSGDVSVGLVYWDGSGSSFGLLNKDGQWGVRTTATASFLYYDGSDKLSTTSTGVTVTGGVTSTGSCAIGTTVATNTFNNGNALAIGDTDTGLRQNGDGVLEAWANNQEIMQFTTGGITAHKTITGTISTATWADTVDVNGGNTSSSWYDVVWHYGDTLYSAQSSKAVEIQSSTGTIRAPIVQSTTGEVQLTTSASVEYNSTTDSIDFVFN